MFLFLLLAEKNYIVISYSLSHTVFERESERYTENRHRFSFSILCQKISAHILQVAYYQETISTTKNCFSELNVVF